MNLDVWSVPPTVGPWGSRCLLAVFAHPDDEAYSVAGTLATYADRGVRTALLCATRGEAGKIRRPELATRDTLAAVRENELKEVCGILGVQDLTFLGYPDGGVDRVDREQAVGSIVRHIRRLRPDVVITFDEVGVYGHPDHIAVHQWTRAAFGRAGQPDAFPEQLDDGLEPHAPARLFANVLPKSVLARLMANHRAGVTQALPGGGARYVAFEAMGTQDSDITTRIVLDDRQFRRKLAAIRAHRTQVEPSAAVNTLPGEKLRPRLGVESFQLLAPTGVEAGPELFAS